MKYLYCNKLPLTFGDLPKHLNRGFGVTVSEPYEHKGFTPPQIVVEIEKELPTMNTQTLVALAVPVDEWKPKSKQMTREVIAAINAIIAELETHRARLIADERTL